MPVFVDGQAQVVDAFSDSSRWVRDVLWVETEFDSDGDGSRDRMHVDVTRPVGNRNLPTRAHMRRKGTRGSLSGFDINLRHQPSTSWRKRHWPASLAAGIPRWAMPAAQVIQVPSLDLLSCPRVPTKKRKARLDARLVRKASNTDALAEGNPSVTRDESGQNCLKGEAMERVARVFLHGSADGTGWRRTPRCVRGARVAERRSA